MILSLSEDKLIEYIVKQLNNFFPDKEIELTEDIKESFKSLTYNIDFLTKEIDRDIANLTKDLDTRCDRIDQNQLEIKALLLSNLGMKSNT